MAKETKTHVSELAMNIAYLDAPALRRLLETRGADTSGEKADLLTRLLDLQFGKGPRPPTFGSIPRNVHPKEATRHWVQAQALVSDYKPAHDQALPPSTPANLTTPETASAPTLPALPAVAEAFFLDLIGRQQTEIEGLKKQMSSRDVGESVLRDIISRRQFEIEFLKREVNENGDKVSRQQSEIDDLKHELKEQGARESREHMKMDELKKQLEQLKFGDLGSGGEAITQQRHSLFGIPPGWPHKTKASEPELEANKEQPPVYAHFLNGRCHFGDKCTNRHINTPASETEGGYFLPSKKAAARGGPPPQWLLSYIQSTFILAPPPAPMNNGTLYTPFSPFWEQDHTIKQHTVQHFETVSAMMPFRPYSLEELRLEDYARGTKESHFVLGRQT